MKGCRDCHEAIFDERLGEYKCKVHKRYIPDPDAQLRCVFWKSGNPEDSKRWDSEEEE